MMPEDGLNLDVRTAPVSGSFEVEIFDRQGETRMPVCYLRPFGDERESDTIERARQLISVIEDGWNLRFGPKETGVK